ncbi:MAG TPA: septal ring lytic transglycosylase RlpA family protein [Solirubrobacteraceae bacterium]|jgi:hypothetical protein
MTMLALPASALALSSAVPEHGADTPAAASGASLRLRIVPQRLQYNHPVTVTGRAPASVAGQTIQLQTAASRGSSWQALRSAKVDRGGGFRLQAALRRSGFVRVVVGHGAPVATAATFAGAAGVAASPAHPVTVAAQLRVQPRPRDLLAGQAVKVAGKLLPARAGRVVHLQAQSPTGWRTLTSTRTGGAGGFQLRSTPANGLQRRLRVQFAGDQANAGTTRSAGRVTVYRDESVASWYDDSGNTACGFHASMGVANRDLPCGTKVRLRYGGRSVTAVVDDRGPFVGGRDWDLNQNTAAALNFGGVGTVWATQ